MTRATLDAMLEAVTNVGAPIAQVRFPVRDMCIYLSFFEGTFRRVVYLARSVR